jgi:6-phosphogluconolactonase
MLPIILYKNEWFESVLKSFDSSLKIGVAGGDSLDLFLEYCKNKLHPNLYLKFIVIDDRDVEQSSPYSNYGKLRLKLGDKFSITRIQHVWDCRINSCKIDLIILGMGEDGHIASIFPEMNEVDIKTGGCAYKTLKPFGNPLLKRFSLQEGVIHSAKKVVLTISSEIKLQLLKDFMFMDDDSVPVVRLIKQHPNLVICKVFK